MAGFIELIAKIKPKNNGKYPLVDDVDVEMGDGTRLSEAIKKPKIPSGGKKGQLLAKKSDNDGDGEWVDGLKMEDVDKKLEGKLDKNLGSENPDKVLTTDSQGNIVLQDKEDFEGSGVTDYNGLNNRPSINGVTLTGNKTSADLDMYTKEEVDEMLYEKMDKPYAPITISDDTTIEDCLDGYFKIDKIKGNTYQAQETDIVPTPSRPVPINSRKTIITKMNLNVFNLEKESDTSSIPDTGTYRSIGQHQLKPNTKYVFSWSGATVPAEATLSFQVQDDKGTVLVSPFTYFNISSDEKEETGKDVEFTTDSSGIIKFAYNCIVGTSSSLETYQQYWYTKILKDISLKEDVEYEPEYVELRSLKETGNLFDLKYGQLLFGEKVGSTTNNGSGVIIENQYAGANSLAHVYLKANTNYFFIANRRKELIDGMEESGNDLNLLNIKKNGVAIKQINSGKTFTLNESGYYDLSLYGTVGCKVSYTSIMLVEGTSAPSTYIPPTVRDYKIVDHTTKTSKIIRNVLEIDANNIKAILHANKEQYISFQLNISGVDVNTLPKYKLGYCSLFLTEEWNGVKDYEMAWIAMATMGISISKDRNISDVEQFLQFVKEKDIKIFAKAATPTEESITYLENDTSEVGYSWQDTTSPSPTIKSEVKGVEEIDILKTGKNLLNIVDYNKLTANGITSYISNDGSIKYEGTSTANYVRNVIDNLFLKKGFYTLKKFGNSNYRVFVRSKTISSKVYVSSSQPSTTFEIENDDNVYLYCSIDNGTSINDIFYPQIEVGNIETAYEPYQEQHVNITPPQPLYENDIANVESCDYEYEKQKYVVTGNETFLNDYQTQSGFYGRYFNLKNGNGVVTKKIWCNYLSYTPASWELASEGCCQNARSQIHLKFTNDRLGITDNTPVEEKRTAFANYLKQLYSSGDPLYVVIKVAKTTQPIPQEDLKLLKSLKTEQGVTNIFVGGEVKPTIEARYPQDIASIVNKLQTKLLTLQEGVVKNV